MARQDRTKSDPIYAGLFTSIVDIASEWIACEGERPQQVTHSDQSQITGHLAARLRTLGFDVPNVESETSPAMALSKWIQQVPNKRLQPHGLGRQIPPKHLHYIGTTQPIFYDLHNADILVDDLMAAGGSIDRVEQALDFGCSTGRTLRTFAAALPDVRWAGIDPVPPSINYAARRFRKIAWHVNEQDPPIDPLIRDLDFVYAKSIWTHFSAETGKVWLNELAGRLRVGGKIAITVHGWHDLSRRVVWGHPSPNYQRLAGAESMTEPEYLQSVADELGTNGFAFRPYVSADFQSDLRQIDGVSTADWGLTFVTHDWVTEHWLPDGLQLVHHGIARTGHRHDVLVYERIS